MRRACEDLITVKKRRESELKDRVMYLQEEVSRLETIVYELEHRIIQLEIARKLGN